MGWLGQHAVLTLPEAVLTLPGMSEALEGTRWLGDKGTRGCVAALRRT